MNFVCDQCKQKYHVADDKIRGRAVTRFKCKKCEHIIELRPSEAVEGGADEFPDKPSSTALAASIPPPGPLVARPSAPRPAVSPTPARAAAAASPSAPARPAATLPMRPAPASSAGAAAPRPAPRIASVPRPGGSGPSLRESLAQRAVQAPPVEAPRSQASTLLDAAETGWYAGLRDLPVGPLTRREVASRIESGDLTGESLVWREGMDDWRPLHTVEDLAEVYREAAQRVSGGLLGTLGTKEPPASPKVVPITSSRPPLVARATPAPAASPSTSPNPSAPKTQAPPLARAVPAAQPTPAAAPPVAAPPAPSAPLAPPAVEAVAPPIAAPAAASALPDVAPSRRDEQRRAAIPVGVWVMMVGTLVAGVAIGLFLQPRAPAPAAPTTLASPNAPTQTAHVEAPANRHVGAEIDLQAAEPDTEPPAPGVAQPVPPAAPGVPAHASEPGRRPAAGAVAAAPRAGRPSGALSPEQLALLNAQMGGGGGVPAATGPAHANLREQPQTQDPTAGLSGDARARQVLGVLNRSGVVGSCWNAAQRRNAAHPPESITVGVDVAATGRATRVTVEGSHDPDLGACIETRARAQFYGAGGAVGAEARFTLTPGS